MAIKSSNHIGLSPSEEILSQLDNTTETPQDGVIRQTKRKLAQVTTAVALGGVLSGAPALAEYKPVYEPLASNEVMLVEKMTESRFLATAGLREKDIAEFNGLGPSEKQAVLDYYSLGISRGLDSKKLRGLAIQLVSFFSSVKNNLDYINGRISRKDVSRFPIESIGMNIDRILGTDFGERGKKIDSMLNEFVDERGRKADERGRKADERGRKLDILLEALKQVK